MANESSTGQFAPDEVFPDFSWQPDIRPDSLHLNQSGFFEDQTGHWYMVRRADPVALDGEVDPQALYLGRGVNWHNATQGAGLYFTNTVQAATKVMYAARSSRQPGHLYLASIRPEADEMLDATNSLSERTIRERLGAKVLQAMAVVPGMPWPTPSMYDFLYANNSLVIAKPSAMQRFRPGMRAHINHETIKPRYAVVRDLGLLSIVGQRAARP